jgi:hypothetical protein
MIGKEHLLIRTEPILFLAKIDYKLWEARVVAKYRNISGRITLDASDQRKFIVSNSGGLFAGTLTGDCIVFGPRKQLALPYFSKLVGNQLFGFRETNRQNNAGISIWRYCNICLDTLREKAVDVPVISSYKPYSRIFDFEVSF